MIVLLGTLVPAIGNGFFIVFEPLFETIERNYWNLDSFDHVCWYHLPFFWPVLVAPGLTVVVGCILFDNVFGIFGCNKTR